MKKLLAILLSVLMLCTMIPFATVFAYDVPTIVAETVSEADAGDEITVEVSLMGNPGIIGALVEIQYDSNVFELVPYVEYDEDLDEDVEYNVERATGWGASYVFFGPPGKCNMGFSNGTASKNVTRELYFTATFKVKDDAVSGTYELKVVHNNKNFFNVAGDQVDFAAESAFITINGVEAPPCEHEYEYDCDKVCSICGEETRPEAEHEYFYPCDGTCMICYEYTNKNAAHTVVHVEAKAPVNCIEWGNVEYWYCQDCGIAWRDADCIMQTNMMSVRIGGSCVNFTYHEAVASTCTEAGNIEYWTCDDCGTYYLDEAKNILGDIEAVALPLHNYFYACDQWCMDCGELTNEAATHSIVHVAAQDPISCTEPGNIEYWTCEYCGTCWDNAQGAGMPLNGMMVKVWKEHTYEYVCSSHCLECGEATNWEEHTYDSDDDLECNVCGEIRKVVSPIVVLMNVGTSVSQDVNGLAFGFSALAYDVVVENGNEFVYGAVIPFDDEQFYPLVSMGAVVSNRADVDLDLNNLDGNTIKDVPAKYLCDTFTEDGDIGFAVRVINIPYYAKNVTVSVRPYFIYELDGEQFVVYGDVISASYNEALAN